ncbi:hypothetical protein D3C84_1053300 [compost metagenome]
MGVAQCLFDKTEASLEFAVGATQCSFGINLEVTRQIDHGKQQVADLVGDRLRVILGHGFKHFVEFFAHLVQHRQSVRPVEADLPCALLQFRRA